MFHSQCLRDPQLLKLNLIQIVSLYREFEQRTYLLIFFFNKTLNRELKKQK